MKDVQNQTDTRGVEIQKVGIKNLEVPLNIQRKDKENIVVVVNISNYCLVSGIIEQIKDIPRRVERAEKILKSMNEKELYEAFGDFGNKDDFLDNEYGIWRYFELGEIEDIIKDVFNERNMVGKGEE